MQEEMAIIEGVGFGMRDAGRPILWFGIRMLSGGSLQVLSVSEAVKMIEENDVRDIKDLNGKPCIVRVDGQIVKFVKLFKL